MIQPMKLIAMMARTKTTTFIDTTTNLDAFLAGRRGAISTTMTATTTDKDNDDNDNDDVVDEDDGKDLNCVIGQ